MDPQVSTSFIPKEALIEQRRRGGGLGLVGLIAMLLFVLSVVAAGGVFAYQGFLNSQIQKKQDYLKTAEDAFKPETVKDLLRLDTRIEQSKGLLSHHVAPSAIFDFLSTHTLVNVQFTSFNYELKSDGSATLELDGVADSFQTVALQSDAFGSADAKQVMHDVVFSDIAIDPSGRVGFTLNATVDSSLISYANVLATNPTLANPAPQPQETATTTPQ